MPTLILVQAILQQVDAIFGLDVAKAVLGLFMKSPKLTAEQKANLDANWQDYVVRIARLRGEVGEAGGTP